MKKSLKPFLLVPIIIFCFLAACTNASTSGAAISPAQYTRAYETAAANAAVTSQVLSLTPVQNPTPEPDGVILEDMGSLCYPLYTEFPKEAFQNYSIIGQGECITTFDSFTILEQINHCEFIRVRTADGREGWMRGQRNPELVSSIQFNKPCNDIESVQMDPANGAYSLFGESLLFPSANAFEMTSFLQDTWYVCYEVPCGHISAINLHIGILSLTNSTDQDAVFVLQPLMDDGFLLQPLAMYVHAGQKVDFPVCDGSNINTSLKPHLLPGGLEPVDVRCLSWSPVGRYRAYATTGSAWDDVSYSFEEDAAYWSLSFELVYTQPTRTQYFGVPAPSPLGYYQDQLSKYYTLDYKIIMIDPTSTGEEIRNERLFIMAPAGSEIWFTP